MVLVRPPRVSVVIPTYNRSDLLAEALDSVLAQTFSDLEVVVVDDGSSDATPELLATYGERLRVIRQPENRGISAARNTGMAVARGDLIAFLDSDDAWYPDKLERQVRVLDDAPWLDCLSAGLDQGDVTRHGACRRDGARDPLRVDVTAVVEHRFGWMSTFIIRRRAAEAIGPFDESLRLAEDKDYFLRAATRLQFERRWEIVGSYRCHQGNSSRWSRDLAYFDALVYERWSRVEMPRRDAAALRRELAMARYHLARFERLDPARCAQAASLFVQAALGDPFVDARLDRRSPRPLARAFQVARPWVAAFASLTGILGRLGAEGRHL